MKLTIARKLGLGFATVILLMVGGAVVAYITSGDMMRSQHATVDEAVPTARACDDLTSAIHASMAALRGYLILGDDPAEAAFFIAEHDAAWTSVEAVLARLNAYSQEWNHDDAAALVELTRELDALQAAQLSARHVAHTDQNVPALLSMRRDVAPTFERAFKAMSAIIDRESAMDSSADRRALLVALADLRGYMSAHVAEARTYALTRNAIDLQQLQRHAMQQIDALERVTAQAALFTAEQAALWEDCVELRGEYLAGVERVIEMRDRPDWNRANDVLGNDVVPRITAIRGMLHDLALSADARVERARADMMHAAGTLRTTLVLATGLAIIVAALVAVALSRKIVMAIGQVVTRARDIASGDLRGEPLAIAGNDEIAALADSFNQMQLGLKDVTSQIRQVTESVNSASAEILAAAQQQAAGTKEQAATLQEITSTMQEICQSGEQVSQRAREVVSSVETTISSNASGIEAVQASTRNMDTIREQVEEVAENIVSLSERTQTISEIIAAVTDIAEQSNLLALNAAIEAVSAGEQGSRFSVVATEMKNLADQAKECTVQVRNILSEIQKGINSSVMKTEEAVKRVETGKQQASTTERTIREMSGSTQTSVQTFEQIIGASAQQQIGFDQVTRGVKDIHIAVEQTAAGVTQLERATASLNALGQQLRTAVDRYRI